MITITTVIVVWVVVGAFLLTKILKREAAKNQATFPIIPPMSFFEWVVVTPSLIVIAIAAFIAAVIDPLY